MLGKRSVRAKKEIALTREGWIYLAILGFITVGAILRNVNLLILMAGMMIAPLVINWRLAVYWLRMISAKRVFPYQLHARQSTSFQWVFRNRSKLTAWGVEIADSLNKIEPDKSTLPLQGSSTTIKNEGDSPAKSGWLASMGQFFSRLFSSTPSRELNVLLECSVIGGAQEEVVSYRIYFPHRGLYQFGPARIGSTFPFGIIRATKELDSVQQLYVAPMIGTLTPVWNRRVRSIITGADSYSRRRGAEEEEFHALRRWQSGDSIKQIHWRTSARLGHLSVKQFEQPDNRDFAILLDLYCPDGADPSLEEYQQRCETVLSFATTALLHLDSMTRGRIGLAICGAETVVLHSRMHREMVAQAMPKLAVVQPHSQPSLSDSLLQLSDSVSASTPIFVISSRDSAPEFAFLSVGITAESEMEGADELASSMQQKHRNRLPTIWPAVCWLDVTSGEFRELFSIERPVDRALQQLTTKWISNNVTR